jgi:hypothetical protein
MVRSIMALVVGRSRRAHHARNPNYTRHCPTGGCRSPVVGLSLTSGEASVKAFLAACLGAAVVAAISWIVLNSVQEPADRAFATSPYTRVGD